MKNLIILLFSCTANFIFSQSYSIALTKQINFRKYSSKKTERYNDFLFLSFISLTQIEQSLKKYKKNILPDETKI